VCYWVRKQKKSDARRGFQQREKICEKPLGGKSQLRQMMEVEARAGDGKVQHRCGRGGLDGEDRLDLSPVGAYIEKIKTGGGGKAEKTWCPHWGASKEGEKEKLTK